MVIGDISNSVLITGGTLSASDGSSIVFTNGRLTSGVVISSADSVDTLSNATFDNCTIVTANLLQLQSTGLTHFGGTIFNSGSITSGVTQMFAVKTLQNQYEPINLFRQGNFRLWLALTLWEAALSRSAVPTVTSDNLISGFGQIGGGDLKIVNNGTISRNWRQACYQRRRSWHC